MESQQFAADNFTLDMFGRYKSDTPVSDILTLAVKSVSGTGDAVGSLSWYDNI